MKAGGLDIRRIRLTAICTVCIKAFLKEVSQLDQALRELGPVDRELAEKLRRESLARLVAAGDQARAALAGHRAGGAAKASEQPAGAGLQENVR